MSYYELLDNKADGTLDGARLVHTAQGIVPVSMAALRAVRDNPQSNEPRTEAMLRLALMGPNSNTRGL